MVNINRFKIYFLPLVFFQLLDLRFAFDADASDAGHIAAEAVWVQLEVIASGRLDSRRQNSSNTEFDWRELHAQLRSTHPHADASGALAWLYLFGVPDSRGSLDFPHGFPRDIDLALAVAQAGARLRAPTCSRCWSMLGLLLSIGFPPLVNSAHVTVDGSGRPSLMFIKEAVTAWPHASELAARLPRDIGRPDPATTAYMIAAHAGDALGVLAVSYLGRHGLGDTKSFYSPGPNQASAVTQREVKDYQTVHGDSMLVSQLAELANVAVEASDNSFWDAPPKPLSTQRSTAHDRAKLQYVLTNPREVPSEDLVEAANKLDRGESDPDVLPEVFPSSRELRNAAIEKGDVDAALHVAVEYLQQNETEKAQPLLEMVKRSSQNPGQPEMAEYYLHRYTGESPNASAAWPHLVKAADLGRQDAQLLVAHANAGGAIAGAPEGSANMSQAMLRYRRLADTAVGSGQLNEMQSFAAYNYGVLSLQSDDGGESELSDAQSFTTRNGSSSEESKGNNITNGTSTLSSSSSESQAMGGNKTHNGTESNFEPKQEIIDNERVGNESTAERSTKRTQNPEDARNAFVEVVLSRLPLVRMALALGQRAARLGDSTGALLLASLTSDLGHTVGHADAASLWDSWAKHRPSHLGPHREDVFSAPLSTATFCNLSGWWTSTSLALAEQNVSRTFVTSVEGGGFEMFNASLNLGAGALAGLENSGSVFPIPLSTQFKHLHSFLWHTTYDVISNGAPIPVALQPPNAVPHLVEHHHQRGKLFVDEACAVVRIEGMHVNWTFHRLGQVPRKQEKERSTPECDGKGTCSTEQRDIIENVIGTREFLHCWIRPSWYHAALEASLASRPGATSDTHKPTWDSLVALTASTDCPCYGAFACRRGDGACVALSDPALSQCEPGSRLCLEVPPELEPQGKPAFAALPEVCALAYHRRSAVTGSTDAMHVLSHAYSHGLRGAQHDASEAFTWSSRAMHAGDARGRFDVAYSLEFGLGIEADPPRAFAMYRDLLWKDGNEDVPAAAQVSSVIALISASGRYLASRLLGGSRWSHAPWADSDASSSPSTST